MELISLLMPNNHHFDKSYFENRIRQNEILVDDSKKAFLMWKKRPGYIDLELALTHPDAQHQGLALILSSYLWSTYRLPVSFTVQAGSDQEQFTSFRSDTIKNMCTLINSFVDDNGIEWHTYSAINPNWRK